MGKKHKRIENIMNIYIKKQQNIDTYKIVKYEIKIKE